MATPITLRQISAPSFKTGAGESLLKQSAADIANAGKLFQDEMARRAEAQYQAEQDALTQQNWQANFDAARADAAEKANQFDLTYALDKQKAEANTANNASMAALRSIQGQKAQAEMQQTKARLDNDKWFGTEYAKAQLLPPEQRPQAIDAIRKEARSRLYFSPEVTKQFGEMDRISLRDTPVGWQNYVPEGMVDTTTGKVTTAGFTPANQAQFISNMRKGITEKLPFADRQQIDAKIQSTLDTIPGYRAAEIEANRQIGTASKIADAEQAKQVEEAEAKFNFTKDSNITSMQDAIQQRMRKDNRFTSEKIDDQDLNTAIASVMKIAAEGKDVDTMSNQDKINLSRAVYRFLTEGTYTDPRGGIDWFGTEIINPNLDPSDSFGDLGVDDIEEQTLKKALEPYLK